MSYGHVPGSPPPPPLARPTRRFGLPADVPVAVVAVVVIQVVVGLGVMWLFVFGGDDEAALVYERYNDALVEGDIAAAWGLTCPSDRADKPLPEFERWVEESIRPLGELRSWSRLRGGAGWHGTRGEVNRRPEIVEEDGQDCVRNYALSALGKPF